MSTNTTRVFPPGGAATTVTINSPVNGLVGYSAGANGSVDAAIAGDADSLKAMGWTQPEALVGSGPTTQRIPAAGKGMAGKWFIDTTLGAAIWSDGSIWRTVAGAAA